MTHRIQRRIVLIASLILLLSFAGIRPGAAQSGLPYWTEIQQGGAVPDALWGGASAYHDGLFYIFGGLNGTFPNDEPVADFSVFDVDTGLQAQENLAPAEAPGPTSEVQLTFPHEEECGSPLVESMGWTALEGTAIEVTGARTFILRTSEGKRVHVDLVAVETKGNQAPARQLLSGLVQGRAVTVLVNPGARNKKRVIGEVHVESKDVSRELLQAGVARFREPPPYSASSYSSCLYRIAEREARQAQDPP